MGIADQIASMAGIFIWGLIITVIVIGVVITAILLYKRKKWNLLVTIRLPREGGTVILGEIAKGYWDAQMGCIMIKRKGRKSVGSRPIDPKMWLQGSNLCSVIQVGPEDFIICLEDGYKVVKDESGNVYGILDITADVGKRKTWKNYFERTAKNAFTLKGFLEEHKFAIMLIIIMFCMFLGFAILWSRIPQVCGGG